MPSINEVWEQALQVNANLVTIQHQLQAVLARADESNDWLADIRAVTADGFGSLSQGLVGVHDRQDVTNTLLALLIRQQEAVICNLQRIADHTCRILNEAAEQTQLQEGIGEATAALDHMYRTSNPDAALVRARHDEERARLEECCPPREPEPACQDEPCEGPAVPEPPRVKDYKPYRPPQPEVARAERRDGPE